MEYSLYDEWAGASSMWASCCGLLNDVMGTGVVRGQQAAFRGGTGPFRFAQSSDFPTFPSSSSSNIVCKACGLAFSVFRKKHICSDCKKDFCSVCSTLQENHRRCCTCHLLQETAFQRARLMKLKVKDLRQYLTLRNIPTDSCREKEDLVELVLCHHASSVPDEETDIGTGNPTRAQSSSFFSHQFFSAPFEPSPSVSSFQGDIPENLVGSATSSQGTSETVSVVSDTEPQELSRARASLSDLSTLAEIEGLTIRQLKEILARNFVNYSGCCEKWELVDKVRRLYKETEENRKSCTLRSERTNVGPENKINPDKEQIPLTGIDENLCRICMDAIIDCVLLECGHMVTCTKCGKRMNECPICRQYVVRAVHVFKS